MHVLDDNLTSGNYRSDITVYLLSILDLGCFPAYLITCNELTRSRLGRARDCKRLSSDAPPNAIALSRRWDDTCCNSHRVPYYSGDSLYLLFCIRPRFLSMASVEPPKSFKSKSKEKERKSRASQKGQSSSERLKTIVRRLPPNLPEEVFWQSVQQWVTDETVTWKEYYQGKLRKRCAYTPQLRM